MIIKEYEIMHTLNKYPFFHKNIIFYEDLFECTLYYKTYYVLQIVLIKGHENLDIINCKNFSNYD